MGIKGLQTFIERTFNEFDNIKLRNCNVVLDGNSIYHQMYSETKLKCLFGGEYDQFYFYCIQLFESFLKCNINVIVVFDGAQLTDRKLSTIISRAKQSIEKSTNTALNVSLSPILLRQTFISVLDTMKIPYVSALGEADDECVSLANHLDCYLIATDSDYFCYNLHRGYIPFESVDIEPMEEDSLFYLSAQSYRINSLLKKFEGLQQLTLALACCLCGNDYIDEFSMRPLTNYINGHVERWKQLQGKETWQTKKLWNAMQWMRTKNDIDAALQQLLPLIQSDSERNKIKIQLETAVQCYLEPSNTLIYRLALSINQNLLRNPDFIRRARTYCDKLNMNEDQLRTRIESHSQIILSKYKDPLTRSLADAVSDLRLSPSFIEILIHRRLICRSHIEFEREPSIYSDAIPILLPCFDILLKWDQAQHDLSVTIHHRKNNQLAAVIYPTRNPDDDIPELIEIRTMPPDERQQIVRKCLKMPHELFQRWNHIPSDYHFWLIIIRYWYTKRALLPVYLYAVIVSLMKYVFLRDGDDSKLVKEQFDSLAAVFDTHQTRQHIDSSKREPIFSDLEEMSKKALKKKTFNIRIIHELNCLQTIYMYSLQLNEFFDKPFQTWIHPHHFICGSLFYGFVDHYKTKQHMNNLPVSMRTLFRNETFLLHFLDNLFQCITC